MKLSYRPEIDGLRAIAVLSVIFYHAQITILGFSPFKGGYIGVDIFFVISGYLITSLILKELKEESKFSFSYFYERRIRRILPVLLFIIIFFIPFGWFFLLPDSLLEFSKSILTVIGFSSNFYFHFSGLEYAGIEAIYKPFLHTWSLSVEEQYYLIFPILVILIYKFYNKYLFHIFILFFFISFFSAIWGSINSISANFYLIYSRFWELLAGSILAYLELKKKNRSENKLLNEILPIIGLLMIIIFIIYNDDKINHPSLKTFFPVFGTCLFIWFSEKDTIHNKIISFRPIVATGLISYSLYLWHYPIFAFARITELTQGNIIIKLFIALIIILLSIFSYFVIEKPFRNKKVISKKNLIKIILSVLVLIVSTNFLIIKNDGFKSRLPKVISEAVDRHGKEKIWQNLKQNEENCWGRIDVFCSFFNQNEKKIYFIGDSHFGSLMNDLKDQLEKRYYNFIPITYRGFFYFSNSIKLDKYHNIDKNYLILQKKINKIVSESNDNIFIIGGASSLYFFQKRYFLNNKTVGDSQIRYVDNNSMKFSSKLLMDEFKDQINKISSKNKIILVYPIPELGFNLQYKLLKGRNWKQMEDNPNLITFPYNNYKAINNELIKFYDSLKNENIHRIYPHKLFCDKRVKNQCVTHDEKNIFFSDEWHPSLYGAKMINKLILDELENL